MCPCARKLGNPHGAWGLSGERVFFSVRPCVRSGATFARRLSGLEFVACSPISSQS
jgi:hypothetical protein